MITKKELESAITSPKTGKTVKQAPIVEVRYDADGKSDEKLKKKFALEKTCAVFITSGKRDIYKIKAVRGGHLYNPAKDSLNYGLEVKDRTTGNPMFELKEVSQASFKNYMNFLTTKYISHLTLAEREI